MQERQKARQGMPRALIIKLLVAKIVIIGVAVAVVFYML
jgi:hypothetical protein